MRFLECSAALVVLCCFIRISSALDESSRSFSSTSNPVDGRPWWKSRHAGSQVPLHLEHDTIAGSEDIDTYDHVTESSQRASLALSSLQIWYNATTGIWDTTGWWNAANIITMIGDFVQAEPNNRRLWQLATRVFANTVIRAPSKNPQPDAENQTSTLRIHTGAYRTSQRSQPSYMKILKPKTFEPISMYPLNWSQHSPPPIDTSTLPFFSISSADTPRIDITPIPNPHGWLDGYYDDDLWWALAWINAYDVTQNNAYLILAQGIFDAVSTVWPTHCFSGGIYWSNESAYVNAIANELFFSTAASLVTRVAASERAKYAMWAEKSIDWLLRSGMINEHGTINDGLDDACENNGQTTWSYNQGVILGGLVEFYRASRNATYLDIAHRIARAAITELSDLDGVLHDVCEPGCGADGTQFKGVFMRNLQRLHQEDGKYLYEAFIKINAESIWRNDRRGAVFGVNWAGPFAAPDAATSSSAMDALVAAIII
ncbi:hypothetical protein ACN47E_004395 [Coniothyrium glycines]